MASSFANLLNHFEVFLHCMFPQTTVATRRRKSMMGMVIRLNGKVSTTRVQASDAGQAKKLVQSQFPNATGLTLHQRFGFPNTTHQKVS